MLRLATSDVLVLVGLRQLVPGLAWCRLGGEAGPWSAIRCLHSSVTGAVHCRTVSATSGGSWTLRCGTLGSGGYMPAILDPSDMSCGFSATASLYALPMAAMMFGMSSVTVHGCPSRRALRTSATGSWIRASARWLFSVLLNMRSSGWSVCVSPAGRVMTSTRSFTSALHAADWT